MGWKYRDLATFPAIYPNALRRGFLQPDEPVLIHAYASEASARESAEFFRLYRFCVRERPDHDKHIGRIVCDFKLRTRITQDIAGWCLWVTVSPTPLSELTGLNADLLSTL